MLRRALLLLTVFVVGCGDAGQGADEPSGEFKVEVVDASFPERQNVADGVELRLTVRNGESDRSLRNVAVTVETKPRGEDAALAFAQNERGAGLSDAGRPVWVLDEGPTGGDSVYDNTWNAGEIGPGKTKELTWKVVPVRAGTFDVSYSVAPGLTGRARAADGRTSGSFSVTISSDPVPARVGDDGSVERGVEASS